MPDPTNHFALGARRQIGIASIGLLDLPTGRITKRLELPYIPQDIAFTNRGTRLVVLRSERGSTPTESGARSLSIWNVRTMEPVGEPIPLHAAGSELVVSTDGRRVAHGTDSDFAIVYDVDPARWRAEACYIAGRALDLTEWSQYFPGRPYRPACSQSK
jgi:hypothetical protein